MRHISDKDTTFIFAMVHNEISNSHTRHSA